MSTDAIFARAREGELQNEVQQLVPERSTPASEVADSATAREYEGLLGILGIILVAIILGLTTYYAGKYLF